MTIDSPEHPVVAIFSDLHLGIYGNSPEWHKIALEWADWVTEDLRSRNVKDIFFLGDFFHNRSEISVQTVHVASEIISKFSDFNMVMVVGNHDCYYKHRPDVHSLGMLKGHSNLTIVDQIAVMEGFGKRMSFIPWHTDASEISSDYMFGHFEIVSFKMNNFKVCDHGLSPESLLEKNGEVFSGHFHNRHSKNYSKGSIHYVGNTFPMDFSDIGNTRGYHLLNLPTGELTFVANPVSPKFEKFSISNVSSLTLEQVRNNIVKIEVVGEWEDDEVEKVKATLLAMKPRQLSFEYNGGGVGIDAVESIEGFDLESMFTEFQSQLKLEAEQDVRVGKIISYLYQKALQ